METLQFNKCNYRFLTNAELSFGSKISDQFPLVLTPKVAQQDIIGISPEDGKEIMQDLHKYGAILFRGFEVNQESHTIFLKGLGIDLADNYTGGLTPRTKLGKFSFSSTEAHKDFIIYPHNEMAYNPKKPAYISFYSHIAGPLHSETPIYNCRGIYEALNPNTKELLLNKSLAYTRVLVKNNKFSFAPQITVKDAFGTEDINEIQEICKTQMVNARMDGNRLILQTLVQPIVKHPYTAENCLNIQLLSKLIYRKMFKSIKDRYSLLQKIMLGFRFYVLLVFANLPISLRWGDNSMISDDVYNDLWQAFESNQCIFKWQNGDVLLLDNIKSAHARLNVVYPRKLYVAMGS